MPFNGKKEPGGNFIDKFYSNFRPGDNRKKKNALPPKVHFNILYSVMAILSFFYLQQYLFSTKVETIPCSQFKQYIAKGTVEKFPAGSFPGRCA